MVIKMQNSAVSNEYAENRKLARNGEENKNGKVQNGSVFMGNLNQQMDPVMVRKEQMQKKAMKLWSDAVSAEQEIDKDIEERMAHMERMQKEMDDLHENINILSDEQKALKEKYGITGEELGGDFLSEYSERYFELEDAKNDLRQQMNEARREYLAEGSIIAGIKQERLKSHTLQDAQKEKDEMMIATSKEVANMLMDEVKDKIDEEQKEREEKAEEKAEKEEAEEERLEAIRDEKKEYEEDDDEEIDVLLSREVVQMDSTKEELKQEVKKMMNEMKLVVEDLKGAAVDEQL